MKAVTQDDLICFDCQNNYNFCKCRTKDFGISFNDYANATLMFHTLIENEKKFLSAKEIQTIFNKCFKVQL